MTNSPAAGTATDTDLPEDRVAGGLFPLTATSLRDQALRAIRAGIIAGEIEAGEVVSVRVLAARLGVSATPVREAVLSLAKDGLLVPIRNKGFRVPVLSDQDLLEILGVRLMLEVPALVQLAAGCPSTGRRTSSRSPRRSAAAPHPVTSSASSRPTGIFTCPCSASWGTSGWWTWWPCCAIRCGCTDCLTWPRSTS